MRAIIHVVLVVALAPWRANAEPLLAFSAAVEGETHIITFDLADGTMENISETQLQPLHGVESYRSFFVAAWSPDGARVAYVTNEPGIHVADLRRGTTGRIVEDSQMSGLRLGRFSWAPDSRRLVFERGGNLFIIDVDDLRLLQLTASPRWDESPAWSPISEEIAFSRRIPEGATDIWVVNVDDPASLRNVTESVDAATKHGPWWSPDGQSLVFAARSEYDPERTARAGLWTVSVDGENGAFTNIDVGLDIPITPSWSPDGSMISFGRVTTHPAYTAVGVARPDGSDARWLDVGDLTELGPPRWVHALPVQSSVGASTWGGVKQGGAKVGETPE